MANKLQTTHIRTPLLHSALLSKHASACGRRVDVYLKMEALQPSGSFKDRGLGHSIAKQQARVEEEAQGGQDEKQRVHIITSSGGNAGLACAYSARQLGLPCTVFVPSSTEDFIRTQLSVSGAEVRVIGEAWDDCDLAARELLRKEKEAGRAAMYVHPFEGDDTIDGHATMVDEIREQLEGQFNVRHGRPDAIVCSAGGTGLARAMMKGLRRHFDDQRPQLIVTQCFGADSFGQSLTQARQRPDTRHTPVTLPAITSKAKSLGARTCSVHAVPEALEYGNQVKSLIVEDDMAQEAAWRFAQDHRLLVELACSCVLSPVYFAKRIMSKIASPSLQGMHAPPFTVVLVVCGGSKINSATIESYRLSSKGEQGLAASQVTLDGHPI